MAENKPVIGAFIDKLCEICAGEIVAAACYRVESATLEEGLVLTTIETVMLDADTKQRHFCERWLGR